VAGGMIRVRAECYDPRAIGAAHRSDGHTAEHEMDHTRTPYLSALSAYLATQPVRLNTPGHHGGSSGPTLESLTGADLRAADIPGLIEGVDRGPSPTPYEEAELLAADAWGAKRSWSCWEEPRTPYVRR
jgi:hypothetical protein